MICGCASSCRKRNTALVEFFRESIGQARARGPIRNAAASRFAFVVRGLWPQYDQGFPSFCQVPTPRLNREIVGANLDLMPSPRADLPRVGSARYLFVAQCPRLFRRRAQGARGGEGVA